MEWLFASCRCLFDYIDVFTIDTDNMMNLEDRLCGEKKPNPIVSVHRRLELVFKSDYARSRRGFKGKYHFLDERQYLLYHYVITAARQCKLL